MWRVIIETKTTNIADLYRLDPVQEPTLATGRAHRMSEC